LPTQSNLSVSFVYNPAVSGAQGWLNWFEVSGRRNLAMNAVNQLHFRDWNSVGLNAVANFIISGTSVATAVWDITNPLEPIKMNTVFTANQTSFINTAERLKEYIVFNNTGFLTPAAVGKMDNQNLHNSSAVDYIIIAPPDF